MCNVKKITLCMISLILINLSIVSSFDAKELSRLNGLKAQIKGLENRLKSLEPIKPQTIADPPFPELSPPSKFVTLSQVIENGNTIPYEVIVNNPGYKRPAYEKYWHSSIGRWSYVPTRIHYALHRLFTNYDIALSEWYDFEQNMGFTIPMFHNKTDLDLYIVVFQTDITAVYTLGNQVVVVGKPRRTGVQVITIKTSAIHPSNTEESLLVQLSTQAGEEMDYTLISYISPDFRLKQKE
ncbi:hypothetical protein C7Y47_19735 [Lysinibacillus sphaericus]|uniref:Uncharacterized protein n=1 Tax=Lysinibacillus sphaericus TaxID=1421 RepID=A0A544U9H7_LYSSH|nr:hypothetical protein [Lysinibacillus sp. SDF0037]TQR28795.1 hypothetical protein C7Y47_19735 [Lysinibacillus sp. SDF0037]